MLKSYKSLATSFLALMLFLFLADQHVRAQGVGGLEGDVKDESGKLVANAVIQMDRTDGTGHFEAKSDKKGHYVQTGLAVGTYKLTLLIDGKSPIPPIEMKVPAGKNEKFDFDIKKLKEMATTGISKEEQAKREKEKEKFSNMKVLFEQGVNLKAQADKMTGAPADPTTPTKEQLYQQALDNLKQAAELDPKQSAIHANLAETYKSLKQYDNAIASYQTALDLLAQAKPGSDTQANIANDRLNLGIIYGLADKLDLAQAEMEKAVQANPSTAARAYFNFGTMLENRSKIDDAAASYQKAIDSDPSYSAAYFRKGTCLMSKATIAPDGKMIPAAGTVEAFQKYLELDPQGVNAAEAKAMIEAFGTTVQTQFKTKPATTTTDKGKKK